MLPELFMFPVATVAGTPVIFRPLRAGDGARLGAYFEGLGAETRRRFGPHPLDTATAHALCNAIDPTQTLRMVATLGDGTHGEAPVIAYFILVMGVTQWELARYAEAGITLDPALECTVAPSVADAYQSQGIGSPCMVALLEVAQQLGRRWMVLMGGVQATNVRAVHFYRKHGFVTIREFEEPPGVMNYDMVRR
jgi:diamine N-acetyltransferase